VIVSDKGDRPEIISIQSDRLELILGAFVHSAQHRLDWVAPLGVLISLLTTYLTASFKPFLGITADQISALILAASGVSAVWLLVAIVRFSRVETLDALLQTIVRNARIARERRALFLIKSTMDNNQKFLVYYDRIWGAYFFPHATLPAQVLTEDALLILSKNIANLLALVPETTHVQKVEGAYLKSIKPSEYHRQDTIYEFEFVHVTINNAPSRLSEEPIQISGVDFAWMSPEEMEAHSGTARKNYDVTRHVRENYDLFYNKLPMSFVSNETARR
jgi:hypothetical protein